MIKQRSIDEDSFDNYEQTSRDLSRMDRGEQAPIEIKLQRMLTEERVACLMRHSRDGGNLDRVRCLVFEADAASRHLYWSVMCRWLDRKVEDLTKHEMQMIEDAWNFFPHRDLDGRCPAELMFDAIATKPYKSRRTAKARRGLKK